MIRGVSAPTIERRAWLLALWVLLLALAINAKTASADGPPLAPTRVHLQWSRPVGSTCIGYDALTQRVEELLGRKVFASEEHADLRIEGTLQAHGAQWHAALQVEGRDGVRHGVRELQHHGTDCAALNPQLIIVLATLTEDFRSEPSDGSGLALAAGMTAGLESGALPKTALGGSLLVGLRVAEAWRIWLDSSAWLPVTTSHALGHGGSFWAWQSGLTLCHELRTSRRVALSLCGGGQLGAVVGKGHRLEVNRQSERLLAQARAEVAIELGLAASVALRASGGGVLALGRRAFFYERSDGSTAELYRPAPVGLLLRVGLLVDLL